jgi:CubicO group peptidase (beta-lactamase class C family)
MRDRKAAGGGTTEQPVRLRPLARTLARLGLRAMPVVLALVVATCATVAGEPTPPGATAFGDYDYADRFLDWIVRSEMARAGIPGCAIEVVTADRVIVSKTYGVTDTDTKTPVTGRTLFRAGSITKSLTALAVMQLAEAGRIDLDAPLSRYLPEFALTYRDPDARPVTPRLLLCHQGGLAADYLHGIMGEKKLSPRELVLALNGEYADFPPGEVFLYSNTGYGLLGATIERVTGRAYEEYVTTEILTPLGLTHSALALTPDRAPLLASGHMSRSLGFFPGSGSAAAPVPYVPIRDAAAGALITDIGDLGAYVQFLMRDKNADGTKIVTQKDFEEMIRPQPVPEKTFIVTGYGYGFMRHIYHYPGVDDIVFHSGNVNGFYSMMAFSPSRGLGIALLTNSTSGFFPSYRIVSRAFRHYLAATAPGLAAPAASGERTISPAPDDLHPYAGHYALMGLRVDVSLTGNELKLFIPAVNMELALEPLGGDRFRPVFRLLGFIPVDIAPFIGFEAAEARFESRAGAFATLYLEGTAGEVLITLGFRRASKPAPAAPAADRRLGAYALVRDERDRAALDLYLPMKEIRLEKRDGWIELSSPELGQGLAVALEFITDDEAVLLGTRETVFFKDDTISLLGLHAVRKPSP